MIVHSLNCPGKGLLFDPEISLKARRPGDDTSQQGGLPPLQISSAPIMTDLKSRLVIRMIVKVLYGPKGPPGPPEDSMGVHWAFNGPVTSAGTLILSIRERLHRCHHLASSL